MREKEKYGYRVVREGQTIENLSYQRISRSAKLISSMEVLTTSLSLLAPYTCVFIAYKWPFVDDMVYYIFNAIILYLNATFRSLYL